MKIVRTQDMHITIPIARIIRTTVEKKDEPCWIVTATMAHDRPITLGRYPSEKEAIRADVEMWLSHTDCYEFPVSGSPEAERRL